MNALRRAWGILRAAARHFVNDNALDYAAVVAFYSLISLGPLAYLVALASAAWLPDDTMLREALGGAGEMIPPVAARALVDHSTAPRGGPGLALLAIPLLLWVATTSLAALEHAVNLAFGLAHRRSRWRSRLKALALIAIGWALLAGLHVARRWIAWSTGLDAADPYGTGVTLATRVAGLLSGASLAAAGFVVFLVFFKILPRTRIPWGSAAAGALVSATAWEAARRIFGPWLEHSVAHGVRSGALASLAALALWIYAAAAIVLAGAEVAAVHGGAREPSGEPSALDPREGGDYVPPPDR